MYKFKKTDKYDQTFYTLKITDFPVLFMNLDKNYITKTFRSVINPLLLEYNFKNETPSQDYHFTIIENEPDEEQTSVEHTESYEVDMFAIFSPAIKNRYCELNISFHQDTFNDLDYKTYEWSSSNVLEVEVGMHDSCFSEKAVFDKPSFLKSKKFVETEDAQNNRDFLKAMSLAMGKILNIFVKDTYLPLAVMRQNLGQYNGPAEDAVQAFLGNTARLEARSREKKTILDLLNATRKSRTRSKSPSRSKTRRLN